MAALVVSTLFLGGCEASVTSLDNKGRAVQWSAQELHFMSDTSPKRDAIVGMWFSSKRAKFSGKTVDTKTSYLFHADGSGILRVESDNKHASGMYRLHWKYAGQGEWSYSFFVPAQNLTHTRSARLSKGLLLTSNDICERVTQEGQVDP